MSAAPKQSRRDHEGGRIVRIYLENFVTYDKVELRPGGRLNVIIGPNGTGKSTIICAIILGLGGKAGLIGRGPLASQYVKTGCESALIEIELANSASGVVKIVRRINSKNQTAWTIDGKAATSRGVEELTAKMNIQLDNFCQLLPQDKVQEFSKMDSRDLLENTEKCVGDSSLHDDHAELRRLRDREKAIDETLRNKESLLDSERQKYEGMKDVVGTVKEKKSVKKKIESLRQKKAWICYDASRKQLYAAKVDRDKAAEELAESEEKLKSVDETTRALEARVGKAKNILEKYDSDLNAKTSNGRRILDEIAKKQREVGNVETERKTQLANEKNFDQEILSVRRQKDKLENDLKDLIEDVGTEESLAAARSEIVPRLNDKIRESERLASMKLALKHKEDNINLEKSAIRKEMEELENVGTQRLELLRRQSPDACEGVAWLRENREKMSGKVHEPMLMGIHAKKPRYTKYLESIISWRDLLAFVCEDVSDMNRLMKYLRDEKKLQINVVFSDPRAEVKSTPRIPLEHLRPYGFDEYLVSQVEAPTTIMNYLLANYHIHNIPLGSERVDDSIDDVPNDVRTFFSPSTLYVVSVSKYSGLKSTRSSSVHGNGMLSIVRNTPRMEKLEKRLECLERERGEMEDSLGPLEDSIRRCNDELEKLRASNQELCKNVGIFRQLKPKIGMLEQKITSMRKERKSDEEIRAAATARIKELLEKQLRQYREYNRVVAEFLQFALIHEEKATDLRNAKRAFMSKKYESKSLREKCADATRRYREFDKELTPLKNETQKLFELASQSTNNLQPSDKEFKPYHRLFAKLPFTVEEIDAEIAAAKAKVYCLGTNTEANEIMENYERTKANIRKLTEETEALTTEKTSIGESIEELRPRWLERLEALIETINKNFSSYFQLVGCAGEVTLERGNSINDFENYGVKIKVKFRDTDELQELTRHRQSGGERAVTTAVYLIALQELSRVPFRCVDEINQGMDSVNERRVFQLIVEITRRQNSCQYFLLTPKLLSDLDYGDSVTVHCVYNGAFMVSCEKFETAAYCERMARS